jgi:hypothetical protein
MAHRKSGGQFVARNWPRNWIVAVALLAAIVASPDARAYPDEPTGFRGIPWGTPQDQVIAKVNPAFNRDVDPGMVEYRSRHDLHMNDIPLVYNYYQFYKGRFSTGIMEAYASHCGSMLDTLIARFGQPTDKSGHERLLWNGTTTAIVYICNRRADFCRVGFESIALLNEREKDLADAARKSPDF